ncbi:DUF1654 domain-containing protein [Pseudomonas bohemica]|uniref:DUF1654 domain-containing protein n=1 Tax=Pseudomonas bohemica TaxID=2044872 RepID=UPI000DA5FB6F|nr:DUF1654 domain-containing protein [Pseudomonas bohemica]
MPKFKPPEKPNPSSYDRLATRVQRIINSTSAQASKRAFIYKSPDELTEDWEQLLIDIDEADYVTLEHRGEGSVLVSWVVPKED